MIICGDAQQRPSDASQIPLSSPHFGRGPVCPSRPRGDEGNLDERSGGISWRVRQLRPYDRQAQTGAETRPPIHVGGAFPHGARRAIRYGDRWIPTARGDVTEVLPIFREMVREAGRDPISIEITSFGLSEDLDRVKRLADSGVARVVASFSPEKADVVLPIVDRWRTIMHRVNG
jgi:alkanesulfonate monooxygenase SsuD/methylene tetrahydromethanopterin reductase-like flavin-dependent oxidoreductase (luciferase family)